MFRPLAYTKTLTMVVAALLAITLDPALRLLLTRVERFDFRPAWLCRVANALLIGEVKSEDRHPVSRRSDRRLRAGGPMDVALEVAGHRRSGGYGDYRHHTGFLPPGIGGHAAAGRRRQSCTCPRLCPASPSARPSSCFRSATALFANSRKWIACWAKRGARKLPPILRPSRCWRR